MFLLTICHLFYYLNNNFQLDPCTNKKKYLFGMNITYNIYK